MTFAQSISLSDLNTLVPKAVSAAIEAHPGIPNIVVEPTIFPGHGGLVGLVIRDAGLDIGAARSLASHITNGMGTNFEAATVVREKDLLVGFFPVERL